MLYTYVDGSRVQYPELGYWILRWDTRTSNPGIPVGKKVFS